MQSDKPIIELIEYEVAVFIRRAEYARLFDKKAGVLDRSAYLLLRQLDEHGPVGVKALADEFQLDISTVSRQTAALEAKGLVQRMNDPDDGRASLFQVTPLGLALVKEVQEVRIERFTNLLKDWSPEDREKFGELLARLNRTFADRKPLADR